MGRWKGLIHEIHRRSLWQVLAIYLVGSWVGYQIVVALVSGLGLPEWFPAFAIMLFIVALPIVLATAFVQEGAPLVGRSDPTLFGRPETAPPVRKVRGLRRLFTWRNATMGGLCAAALWGVIATAWLLVGRREGREAAVAALGPGRVLESEDLPSIAVLPFVNMSADRANEYFSDGITEEIITDLSKLKILRVVSRSATFRYKGKEVDPREVGRELGVKAILEGSVRKEGDRLRITAQLINVEDGFHLWSDDYDRRYEDVFAVQDEVSDAIAQALRLNLTESDRASIHERPTENLEAYEFYSKARYEFYKYTPEGNAAAIQLFEKALALDENYTLALAGLSLCQSQYINRGWSDDETWLERAEGSARKALEIDPDLAEAHFALGFVYEQRRMYDEEEAEMRVALALNPNHAHAHDSLADVYKFRGLLHEALAEYAIALRLDPFLAPSLWNVGIVHHLKGRYRDALRQYRKTLDVHPEFEAAHATVGDLLREQGSYAAARESYEAALAIRPSSLPALIGLARSLIPLRDFTGARSVAERALRVGPERPGPKAAYRYVLGRIALAQGDTKRAIQLFREAAAVSALARGTFQISLDAAPYAVALAEAYLAGGEARLAVEQFESALRDEPQLKKLRYELAWALERAGNKARALAEYQAFLEAWKDADPDAPALIDAKNRVAALSAQTN